MENEIVKALIQNLNFLNLKKNKNIFTIFLKCLVNDNI